MKAWRFFERFLEQKRKKCCSQIWSFIFASLLVLTPSTSRLYYYCSGTWFQQLWVISLTSSANTCCWLLFRTWQMSTICRSFWPVAHPRTSFRSNKSPWSYRQLRSLISRNLKNPQWQQRAMNRLDKFALSVPWLRRNCKRSSRGRLRIRCSQWRRSHLRCLRFREP